MRPRVALTVDVEHADTTARRVAPMLAELLLVAVEHEVPLTLFVQGRWARAHADELGSHLVADPLFRWATHGSWHAPWPALTAHGLRADLEDGQDALDETLHPFARQRRELVRAPFGHLNRRARRVTRAEGYTVVGWDCHFGDWLPSVTAETVFAPPGGLARDGGIVLLHHWTAAAPRLLDELARMDPLRDNVEFVGLDDPAMLTRRIATGMTLSEVPCAQPRNGVEP